MDGTKSCRLACGSWHYWSPAPPCQLSWWSSGLVGRRRSWRQVSSWVCR